MARYVYEPFRGDTIKETAERMVAFANYNKKKYEDQEVEVVALFNDYRLTATPESDPQTIIDYFVSVFTPLYL